MADPSISCPSCGGPIELEYKYTQAVVCPYCGQTNHVNADAQLDPRGEQQTPLVDYGSLLSIGAHGELDGRGFRVRGRLRYEYPGGYWDEWLVLLSDDREAEHWLQEDDGEFTLLRREPDLDEDDVPAFAVIRVGEYVAIDGRETFIREKSQATVAGGEGELPFMALPGEQADFVDGFHRGQVLSLEYLPADEVEVCIGRPVPVRSIRLTKG